jgi:DNA invertase Pin-like site-specific DNA recombinase
MRFVGYVRVSTAEQGESGAGLEAQREAIAASCVQRGWQLVKIEQDVASGKSRNGRHGLDAAIAACERSDADGLIVSKLDRLSRSVVDFAGLLERARRKGWALVALDLGVDTSTPSGEMMANVVISFAQYERRLIGQRTKDALAVKKAQGVKLGRASTLPASTRRRILSDRARGLSYRAIADRLNVAGVPTGQGGKQWYPMTVRTVALSEGGGS